jgi:carboxylate-amine ligase
MTPRAASSVDVHRFGSSAPYTVGVEEEFMLIDPETLDLVQRADAVLDSLESDTVAVRTGRELFQSEVEGETPVCAGVRELATEVGRVRAHLVGAVTNHDLLLASSGTHPFARYEDQIVTESERYQRVVEQLQYPVRRVLIFGLHVHVGVPTPEVAIRAVRLLRPHLADLIALSASSPFWRGVKTGLASTRLVVFGSFPRSSTPPAFRSYSEFSAYVRALEVAGALDDYTRIWWDIRPHPRFGTVEVRVMDGVARADDAVALAAYVQALVKRAAESPPPPPATALEEGLARENAWQAVRYGLDAALVEHTGAVPIRDRILRTLEDLEPYAADLGSEAALLDVERILRTGNGAVRQLAVFAETSDLRAVSRAVAEETASSRATSAFVPLGGGAVPSPNPRTT